MSAAVKQMPMGQHENNGGQAAKPHGGQYKGFVAGVFSGLAKLTGTSNTGFVLSSECLLMGIKSATHSIRSKSVSKPPNNPISPVRSTAFYKRFEKKGLQDYIKAQHLR